MWLPDGLSGQAGDAQALSCPVRAQGEQTWTPMPGGLLPCLHNELDQTTPLAQGHFLVQGHICINT